MKAPQKTTAIKGGEIFTYRLSTGRYAVCWYDTEGRRQRRSRATQKEVDALVEEIKKGINDTIERNVNLDDRQSYNLARELVEPYGYSVLQAVREWEKSKAPYRGKILADVISELIAAKKREALSPHYVNRLEDDLTYFSRTAPPEIEKITSADIKTFLNSCDVGPRRWNNLRDQIVTLFRFARGERYLAKDRSTEAEDVTKMKVARKTVETFTPKELELILTHTREIWRPWVLLSAYAGIRTFEVLRMDWSFIRWEQRLIDLPPKVTKVNERRIIPMCDTLIDALNPWRSSEGPVCTDKVPQREIEQILPKIKETMPKFKWKHNALRHSFGSYRTALTQNIPQVAIEMGNSIQMVKRHYLEAQTFDAGLDWFGIKWPVPQDIRSKHPFLRWVAA